jgi:hypothetical protein
VSPAWKFRLPRPEPRVPAGLRHQHASLEKWRKTKRIEAECPSRPMRSHRENRSRASRPGASSAGRQRGLTKPVAGRLRRNLLQSFPFIGATVGNESTWCPLNCYRIATRLQLHHTVNETHWARVAARAHPDTSEERPVRVIEVGRKSCRAHVETRPGPVLGEGQGRCIRHEVPHYGPTAPLLAPRCVAPRAKAPVALHRALVRY